MAYNDEQIDIIESVVARMIESRIAMGQVLSRDLAGSGGMVAIDPSESGSAVRFTGDTTAIPGDQVVLVKTSKTGWKVIGALTRHPPTLYTITATGTWVPPPSFGYALVRGVGGGGGSGGAETAASGGHAAAGGGGGGGYFEQRISGALLASPVTVTIGAGGAAGASGGGDGGTGGATSFGGFCGMSGGIGGAGAPSSASTSAFAMFGGYGGNTPSGSPDLSVSGWTGHPGGGAALLGWGGNGADSPFGAGGRGAAFTAAGNRGSGDAGRGYGSGGGGACTTSTGTAIAGSAGAPGVVYVLVYY